MGSFVGRTDDVARVRALLAGGERLVTLTGAAGIGKTRLAREVVARIAQEGGAVVECELAEARTIDDAAAAIARAFRHALRSGGARGLEDLADRIAARGEVLLVLDECERMVQSARDVVATVLARAPAARVLVTSRERLRLPEERVHDLAPLAIDAGVDLLVEHVARTRGGSAPEERAVLARIVEELDGLPLALELAAVRVAVLGAKNVLERLDRRFDVLTRDASAGEARTLRRAMDASWDLLTDVERRVLCECAVFRGGFTLEAALAVSGEGEGALDAVQSLCEKSLVFARYGAGGAARFGLYATIREYAEAKLDPELRAAAVARHAEHYLGASRRDARERDNLFAVAERALARADAPTSAAALLALAPIVLAEGPIDPYVALLDAALAAAHDAERRIALLSARGRGRRRRGRVDEAARDQREAIALARGAGDARLEGQLVGELGMTAYARCDYDAAIATLREALALQTAANDAKRRAVTLTRLAMAHRERGELDDARRAASEALPLHRAAGDAVHEAATIAELALCDLEEGDLAAARAALAAALDRCAPTGNRVMEAFVHGFTAVVDHAAGELPRAEAGYVAALRTSRDVGYPRFEGGTLGYLGVLAFDRGELDRAADDLARACAILAASGDRRHFALFSGYLASCLRARGDLAAAQKAIDEAYAAVHADDPMRTAVDLVLALGEEAPVLPPGTTTHAARSWDVRLALARVEHAGAVRTRIVVAEDGSWIARSGAERVMCDRRPATQRILAALARAPGRAFTAAELVAEGWPGERILLAAAKNRLRVAVAWLRKAALEGALVSVGDGYALDPCVVAIAPPASEGERVPRTSDVRSLAPISGTDRLPRAVR